MTKDQASKYLDNAQEIWNIAHTIAGAFAQKNIAGQTYLLIEGATGSAIIDTARGDSANEQLIATTADIIAGAIAVRFWCLGRNICNGWIGFIRFYAR